MIDSFSCMLIVPTLVNQTRGTFRLSATCITCMYASCIRLSKFLRFELICLLLFTCNYVVSVWRGFLFLWVLGLGYVILLWHSLSLPYNYFAWKCNPSQTKTTFVSRSGYQTQQQRCKLQKKLIIGLKVLHLSCHKIFYM